jgi:hypothetical protein
VVVADSDGWKVTGTTGPHTISGPPAPLSGAGNRGVVDDEGRLQRGILGAGELQGDRLAGVPGRG